MGVGVSVGVREVQRLSSAIVVLATPRRYLRLGWHAPPLLKAKIQLWPMKGRWIQFSRKVSTVLHRMVLLGSHAAAMPRAPPRAPRPYGPPTLQHLQVRLGSRTAAKPRALTLQPPRQAYLLRVTRGTSTRVMWPHPAPFPGCEQRFRQAVATAQRSNRPCREVALLLRQQHRH